MHMGAENMAKKAAKRKNTRKNTGSRKNGGRNRLWIIFAGCCIALALAFAVIPIVEIVKLIQRKIGK